MRVAIYARVSMPDRQERRTSDDLRFRQQEVQNQLLQLREYCWKQNWDLVAEFTDQQTGSDGDRPGFKGMWDAAEAKQFDILLFWALDRFSREGTLATLQYLEHLRKLGIKFKSYTESYLDTLGPFGDVVIALVAAMAQQERIKISERTKAGLQRLKAKGVKLGRPRILPIDRNYIALLRESTGISTREIARQFGFSKSHAARILKEIDNAPATTTVEHPIADASGFSE